MLELSLFVDYLHAHLIYLLFVEVLPVYRQLQLDFVAQKPNKH